MTHLEKRQNGSRYAIRFEDNIVELDNEEIPEDYFTSEHVCQVNIIREFRADEYKGEILLIGKVLQEIEESSDNKEKRVEIRRKKRQV